MYIYRGHLPFVTSHKSNTTRVPEHSLLTIPLNKEKIYVDNLRNHAYISGLFSYL